MIQKGDRISDSTFGKSGTVIDVEDYGVGPDLCVITVEWDGGGISDFTPDHNTKLEAKGGA